MADAKQVNSEGKHTDTKQTEEKKVNSCHSCGTTEYIHPCSYENCNKYVCYDHGKSMSMQEGTWGCSSEHMSASNPMSLINILRLSQIGTPT